MGENNAVVTGSGERSIAGIATSYSTAAGPASWPARDIFVH